MIRKVLFVDDDQILQRAVGKQFEAHAGQFEVVFADDGFDAVKKLEKFAVSLICTDLMMPRMDGASLLAHVRENYPDIPAIIISELRNDQVEHLIAVDGIAGYFKKPFQADRLAPTILEVLQDEANGGIMHTISPTTFMQLMEMEGKTCTIRMLDNHSVEGAILYLKDGMLLDARVGRLRGIDAAYKAFAWDEVTVFFKNECELGENRINSDLQALIMGALAAKDEREGAAAGETEDWSAGADLIAGIDADDDFQPPADSPAGSAAKNKENSGDSRHILQQKLSDLDGIEAIYYDEKAAAVMKKLAHLGEQSGFGSLKAAHVQNRYGKNHIIIPGEPPTALAGGSGLSVEKILVLLQNEQ